MLGRREQGNQTLSQGAFVDGIVKLISSDPRNDAIDIKRGKILNDYLLPLRRYFIEEKDEVILKILLNYFKAYASVFSKEWNNPNVYILTKSIGFAAMTRAFSEFFSQGISDKTLTYEFFHSQITQAELNLRDSKLELTSKGFSSSNANAKQLSDIFTRHLK